MPYFCKGLITIFKKSKNHANANCLSRLPVVCQEYVEDVVDVFQLEIIDTLPVTAKQIAKETSKDEDLSQLMEAIGETGS